MEISSVYSHLESHMFAFVLSFLRNQKVEVNMLATFSSLGNSEFKASALYSLVVKILFE